MRLFGRAGLWFKMGCLQNDEISGLKFQDIGNPEILAEEDLGNADWGVKWYYVYAEIQRGTAKTILLAEAQQ